MVGEAPEGTVAYSTLDAADPSPIVPRGDDDLAALLYTGGTTGRAKGVMLTHRGLWSAGHGFHAGLDPSITRTILPLPLSHAAGMLATIVGMHNTEPDTSVMLRWFDAPSWVRLVEEHRIQLSAVVPSMLTMILQQPLEEHDLSSLVALISGAAPLPMALREQVRQRLGAEIYETYGLTESSAGLTANKVDANRPGSVGRPIPGVEVAILDLEGRPVPVGTEGEVCARGPDIMKGYWKDEEQTAQTLRDGWLHTGDVGRVDEEGYLYIVDRMKDLIIRGGFNVYPRDVRVVEAVPLTSIGKTDRKAVRKLFA